MKSNIDEALAILYAEKAKLERAILALEDLRNSAVDYPLVPEPRKPGRRGRTSMDLAEREEVSSRMKKYWAGRRAAKETAQSKTPQ